MNKLNIIQFINPSWHRQLTEFLDEHPYMFRLLPIVAIDEYPSGFNKNPQENDKEAPRNVFEVLLYGIARSNVKNEEGRALFIKISHFLRTFTVFPRKVDMPIEMTPRKRRTIQDLIDTCLDNGIHPPDLKYEEYPIVYPIDGLGDSVFDILHLLYAKIDDEAVIPYTEPNFVRGMEMIYGIERPTIEEMQEVTKTWKNKKVGVMFITQYAHYSEYIDNPEAREKEKQKQKE